MNSETGFKRTVSSKETIGHIKDTLNYVDI